MVVFSSIILKSAGILSPVLTITMSPGTSSLENILFYFPERITYASSGYKDLSASIAASALLSCQTPIVALAIRISKITKGST